MRAFKAAALSVTQLYKTAAAEEEVARDAHDAGYTEALDDLLALLDDRNLGLGDGEGWQVREWATQRHQSMNNAAPSADKEPTPMDEEDKGTRSVSPILQTKPVPQYQNSSVQTDPEPQHVEAQAIQDPPREPTSPKEVFQFRSPMSLPVEQDIDMTTKLQPSPPSVRVELHPRGAKGTPHRSRHHSGPGDRIPSISLGTLGAGAGTRRKLPLHEFFDVSGVGAIKDIHPSSKRQRQN